MKKTLGELKMRKMELRNQMDEERQEGNLCIQPETFLEYNKAIRALKWAEAKLLKPIVVTVILLLLFIQGCQTFKGATGDSAWMLQKLSDNIQTEK